MWNLLRENNRLFYIVPLNANAYNDSSPTYALNILHIEN